MRITKNFVFSFSLALILSGCAKSPAALEPTVDAHRAASNHSENKQDQERPVLRARDSHSHDAQHRLIAIDLVNAMLQVPRLHPSRGVIYMAEPYDFGIQLSTVMEIAGYNLQISSAESATPFLSYSVSARAQGRRYQIDVDGMKIRRTYELHDNGANPKSTLFVYGINPELIQLRDGIFEQGVLAAKPVSM